jgi:chaperonin cofactor prefoldin
MNTIEKIIYEFPDEMKQIGTTKYKIIAMTSLFNFILLELNFINGFYNEDVNNINNKSEKLSSTNRIVMIIQINNLYFKNNLFTRKLSDNEYYIISFNLDKTDVIKNNFDDTLNTIKKYNKDYKFYICNNNISLINNFNDIIERKKTLEYNLEEKNNELFEKEEILKYLRPDHPILEEKCAICLDEFSECPDDIVTLSCGHLFCGNCLSSLKKKECPVCKMGFIGYSQNLFIRNMLKKSSYSVAKIEYDIVKGKICNIQDELNKINKDYNSLLDKKEDIIKRKHDIELELKNIDKFLSEKSDT